MDIQIRQLTAGDAAEYAALRQEALLNAPLAFASSPEDDRASSAEAVVQILAKGPDNFIVGAFAGAIIGAAGFYRDQHVKAAHKGHIWGMYVRPGFRRHRVASKLLAAVVEHARTRGIEWIHLGVSAAAPEAKQLYERVGFRVWGTEPDALRYKGQSEVEHFMAMRILPEGG